MALASSRLFQQAPAERYSEKARLLQPPNCELLVRLSHISIATKTDLWLSMASDWAKPKVGGLWFVCWCFPWLKHQEVINPHCDPWLFETAFWTACMFLTFPRPSMVKTSIGEPQSTLVVRWTSRSKTCVDWFVDDIVWAKRVWTDQNSARSASSFTAAQFGPLKAMLPQEFNQQFCGICLIRYFLAVDPDWNGSLGLESRDLVMVVAHEIAEILLVSPDPFETIARYTAQHRYNYYNVLQGHLFSDLIQFISPLTRHKGSNPTQNLQRHLIMLQLYHCRHPPLSYSGLYVYSSNHFPVSR